MIEITLLDYLADALDVPVQMMRTGHDPAAFVLLKKSGDDEKAPGFYTCTVTAESYGASEGEAAQLRERVKSAMQDIDGLSDVVSCKFDADSQIDDTTSKRYCCQAVFCLTYYQ